MLIFENAVFAGVAHIRIKSNNNRFVVYNGNEYTEICLPSAEVSKATEGARIDGEPTPAEEALTRYINEQTGANDPDLVSATERLLTSEE